MHYILLKYVLIVFKKHKNGFKNNQEAQDSKNVKIYVGYKTTHI